MTEIEILKRKRGNAKSQVTRFSNFITNLDRTNLTEDVLQELHCRMDRMQLTWTEFADVQIEIEGKLGNTEEQNNEREKFEDSYFKVLAQARSIIKPCVTRANSQTESNQNCDTKNVKLPTINLPDFDGTYSEWYNFRDTFKSLIHSNKAISEVQKFHYLRASLKKEAAHVIESLEVSGENYSIAWELLNKRFDNKRLIVSNHVRALYNLNSVQRESHVTLRELLDNIEKHLRALKNLGQPTDYWDTLLIFMISSKLDTASKREWELSIADKSNEMPTLETLLSFLANRCNFLETLRSGNEHNENKAHKSKTTSLLASEKIKCNICNQGHFTTKCDKLNQLDINERIEEVKKRQLCFNCLKSGHNIKTCKSSFLCKHCNKKHHSLLHIESKPKSEITSQPSTSKFGEVSLANHSSAQCSSQILLSTVQILVLDAKGDWQNCRALLDCGSQSNFVTEELFKRLNLRAKPTQLSVYGISQVNINPTHQVDVTMKSKHNNFETTLQCLILAKITENLPLMTFKSSLLPIPANINLADPKFWKAERIDMLIGASIFWNLLCIGQIKLGPNMPNLHKTKLGWVLSGFLSFTQSNSRNRLVCNFTRSIERQLVKFWELEECQDIPTLSADDQECENNFLNKMQRTSTGRFIVTVPFTENNSKLGNSRHTALKRLYSLEKRFDKNNALKEDYLNFMSEYETLGHMVKIEESVSSNQLNYYLPHHAVFNEKSVTTKTRVVFDASAKTDSGLSLNDAQLTGPVTQNELFTILLRFRRHTYVIAADIKKMFRQILIAKEDRPFHRILWRGHSSDEIQCYELQTVTYGTASASFLATRCLKQLAIENHIDFPEACEAILNDFYVDDVLTGTNTLEALSKLRANLSSILLSGGFTLHKWFCNVVSTNKDELRNVRLGDAHETKMLGVLWNPASDQFQYEFNNLNTSNACTKRVVLSITAKIFDPLGLIGPVTIIAKQLIQRLWQLKLSWDESLPHDLNHKWMKFIDGLSVLTHVRIPRQVIQPNSSIMQCHGFSDASETAYGACVYVRSVSSAGQCTVQLLCAKSRVAPLRKTTIPRLELCAALLLTRLIKKVRESSGFIFDSFHLWSDSTITLAWIRSSPSKWQTFVANRVADIQAETDTKNWQHVKSSDNPADLISRGVALTTLLHSSLWWQGPPWLTEEPAHWPTEFECNNIQEDLPEERKRAVVLTVNTTEYDLFKKFSSIVRLKRVLAWCYRFIKNARKEITERKYGPLTTMELNFSLTNLVKRAQSEVFLEERSALRSTGQVKSKSPLLQLNPFLDENNLLRVGGRIKFAPYGFDKKHPIILPKNHTLTNLIIKDEHERLLHGGSQAVLAGMRENYWPIDGKKAVKKILRNCVTCFKIKPTISEYLMGNLPKYRITPAAPFQNCGIDYAGPFLLKDKKTRGNKTTKSYVCLFICLVTKAIHLELTSDLTTQSFIATLRRFVARRGKPQNIFSDNASNFIGANCELKELARFMNNQNNQNELINSFANENITWHFSPPRSPHFGGIWEAGIKSVKYHLKRVIGNAGLIFEDFYTILTQIEAILNSRPITQMSDDPTDLTPLSPGHFLIGRPLTSLPDPDVLQIIENRRSQFQRLQALTQHFWKRWSKEYLVQLQTRVKWKRNHSSMLKIGSLVLLQEENEPPLRWKMGRVMEIHPGEDGIARVATVRTSTSIVKRAVRKMCVLPISD